MKSADDTTNPQQQGGIKLFNRLSLILVSVALASKHLVVLS